jgi:predicted RNA polymerase sigma factor
MAFSPAAGLAIAYALAGEPALASYHLPPSVRGDLLMKLGRFAESARRDCRHSSRRVGGLAVLLS